MSRPELPMPPVSPFAPLTENKRFFKLRYDTMDVPAEQDFGTFMVLTPTFENLIIYGRSVDSPYEEDQRVMRTLGERGRVMGEWFSVACPEGELGTNELSELEEITAEEFSAAYVRGWS